MCHPRFMFDSPIATSSSGLRYGKRTKQQRAHAAEDRGVHADAEREADDGGEGERRVLERACGTA